MLDSETKAKINSARDILVGKIPNPQSQVEQITIALIYKFMDDMDQLSVEMGGKKTFFVGEYERFGWRSMFNPKLGGFEMFALYSEALQKMDKNPSIPQLFRDIFKDAYLPFNDPETLRLFLKEIDWFTYDHSEKLGDSFEYLLSVMSAQGDAGQFRTPRHIIEFIVDVVDPKKEDRILDPACGTAGFLLSAYKHIREANTEKDNGDLLTPDERTALMKNFQGYDISPDMVRLALVNMYLHNFPQPNIVEYDTLSSVERWNEYYDVILANPPFMSPKGGIRPHKRFSVQSKRSEVLFVDYIAEHLTPQGRAGVIVPEGIIFQSQNAYKELRKKLVEDHFLWAVVSLPSGVFNPYSGVKTSILFFDKVLAKQTNEILFLDVKNDGFDLGANKKPIDKNDLPSIKKDLLNWRYSILNRKIYSIDENSLIVDKKRIAENGKFDLSRNGYKIYKNNKAGSFPIRKLAEICIELKTGFAYGKSQEEGVLHFRPMNINSSGSMEFKNNKYIPDTDKEKYKDYQIKIGDVLFNNTNSKELVGKTCYVDENIDAYYSNHITRIRVNPNKINPIYLSRILNSLWKKEYFLELCNKWVGQAGVNNSKLSEVTIPVPPIEVQEEIVAEIEGYQRIIDGARQVVEAWKPDIAFELEEARRSAGVEAWEIVKLGDVADLEYGFTDSAKDEGDARFIRITDIRDNGTLNTNTEKFININNENKKYLLNYEDILVARTGATYGKTLIYENYEPAIFASYLIRINFLENKINRR